MTRVPFVNQDECISCGLCTGICPGVFRFDSSGRSFCHDPGGAGESEIQAAIDGCPVKAISWTG